MESLEKLLGGPTQVRLMRLFLFNPAYLFTVSDLVKKGNLSVDSVRQEIRHLLKAGFIRRRALPAYLRNRAKRKENRRRGPAFSFNANFSYAHPLRNLLIEATPLRGDLLLRRLNRVGKLKLVVVSGLLMQQPDSRLDLLIVGDKLKKGLIDRVIHLLEAEIGKELKYAFFESADFVYRLNVYDKLLRDVFDFPHEKLLDRLGLPLMDETYPHERRQAMLPGATL